MLKSNKYINNIVLALFTIMLIISCENISPNYLGVAPHIVIRPDILEPSTDIIVECTNVNMFDWLDDKETLIDCYGGDGERDADKLLKRFYNSRVERFSLNIFDLDKQDIYYQVTGYHLLGVGAKNYDDENRGSSFKQKISGYKAIYTLKSNVTTSGVSFYSHAGGSSDMFISIKYPELLSLDKSSVSIGDEIEITSSKPFFDEETFSQEKLNNLLDINYYIVYITRDIKIPKEWNTNYYKYAVDSSDDVFIYNDNVRGNFEKCPLLKKYYVIDKITPYKVVFRVPSYAKSGKVHIINETGFEISGDKSKSIIVSKPNSYAYYSTKEELVILDESGNEIR